MNWRFWRGWRTKAADIAALTLAALLGGPSRAGVTVTNDNALKVANLDV